MRSYRGVWIVVGVRSRGRWIEQALEVSRVLAGLPAGLLSSEDG